MHTAVITSTFQPLATTSDTVDKDIFTKGIYALKVLDNHSDMERVYGYSIIHLPC